MSQQRIRRAIREDKYEFSAHALEEMDNDNLTEAGVRRILLNGQIEAELTDDPRGSRSIVRDVIHSVEVEVVCRFLPASGLLRIITVYAVEG
jgi:hypothetical protein